MSSPQCDDYASCHNRIIVTDTSCPDKNQGMSVHVFLDRVVIGTAIGSEHHNNSKQNSQNKGMLRTDALRVDPRGSRAIIKPFPLWWSLEELLRKEQDASSTHSSGREKRCPCSAWHAWLYVFIWIDYRIVSR